LPCPNFFLACPSPAGSNHFDRLVRGRLPFPAFFQLVPDFPPAGQAARSYLVFVDLSSRNSPTGGFFPLRLNRFGCFFLSSYRRSVIPASEVAGLFFGEKLFPLRFIAVPPRVRLCGSPFLRPIGWGASLFPHVGRPLPSLSFFRTTLHFPRRLLPHLLDRFSPMRCLNLRYLHPNDVLPPQASSLRP